MLSIDKTDAKMFLLVFNMLVDTTKCMGNLHERNNTREGDKCALPLTTLDFIHNFTQPDLEIIWPCEARLYWLSLKPFVKFVRFLLGYITPLIIVVGVLLNTISFGLLSTPVLLDSSLSLYLRVLAISDNGALVCNYAVGIAKSQLTFVNELFMNSRFLCSLNSVTMEFFQFTSTWLVVALTWARVFAIMFPFGIRGNICNCSALITITSLTCVSLVISLTKLYSGGYETDSVFEFIPCQKKMKPWGSAMYFYIALSTWLPVLFIFVGNILLIVEMKKSERIQSQLTQNFRKKTNRTHHISRTLFVVSTVYLILLVPLGVVETLELYWDVILIKFPGDDPNSNAEYINWLQEKMLLKWCRGFFFHVYHWNFAINFFLYYLTGEKFRKIVVEALKSYKNLMWTICLDHGKCASWSNCCRHLTTVRSSSVLLIRVITLSQQSMNNVAAQNGNAVIRNT